MIRLTERLRSPHSSLSEYARGRTSVRSVLATGRDSAHPTAVSPAPLSAYYGHGTTPRRVRSPVHRMPSVAQAPAAGRRGNSTDVGRGPVRRV